MRAVLLVRNSNFVIKAAGSTTPKNTSENAPSTTPAPRYILIYVYIYPINCSVYPRRLFTLPFHNNKLKRRHRCRLVALTRRSLLFNTATTLGCACCLPATAAIAKSTPTLHSEYEYITNDAAVWKGVCATGKSQSPIDLASPPSIEEGLKVSPFGAIKPQYPRFTQATCVNSGHGTPQVILPKGITCTIGEDTATTAKATLELVQFHFHTPSEHSIDGKHQPMEVHLVHKDLKTGQLVVIAVLCEAKPDSGPNPVVAAALNSCSASNINGEAQPLKPAINLLALLPTPRSVGGRNRPYVTYQGSLTTPPCSETVRWFVLLDSVKVSPSQVLQLQYFAGGGKELGFNARQQQNLGDRDVSYCL